jgi:5-(carboxyamino)imidazole ribonucleotide synthase
VLNPGATIGILGGGQLARMLALAAAPLGLKCHVYAPDTDSCAFDVVHAYTIADYEDEQALARFAQHVDVVTYEFENVPAKTAAFLTQHTTVLPDPHVLETTQDRLAEKNFVARLGIATAPFAAVHSATQLADGLAKVGLPAVLKTARFGYDGKGQAKIERVQDANDAWRNLRHVPCILEGFVKFRREVSVIAARGADGAVECFEVTENEHRDHILHISRVPAKVTPALANEARRVARQIVEAFGYVGVMGVEMFMVRARGAEHVLVNEVAPRVHNSGHWTIDGATVSQFEQHIRAVAGWPLAKPARLGQRVEMINLIGDEILDHARWLTTPNTALHVYGKGAPSPRRKMGHVTRVWPGK